MKKMKKSHVRIGDLVKILIGKDKGKVSKVLSVNKKKENVIVKDINLAVKHISKKKSGESNESGGIQQIEQPIHLSNVMVFDEEIQQASRIGMKYLPNEETTKIEKVRYFKKSNKIII